MKALSNDDRLEFISYVKTKVTEAEFKEAWDQLTKDDDKADKHYDDELTHHRNFHLNEEYDRNASVEQDSNPRDLSKFAEHIRKVEADLQNSWQYVPFDMPGDYLQCMPNPQIENGFILV